MNGMLYKENSWCRQWVKHGAMIDTTWVEKSSFAHCQEHGNALPVKSEVKFYVQQFIKEAKNWL